MIKKTKDNKEVVTKTNDDRDAMIKKTNDDRIVTW